MAKIGGASLEKEALKCSVLYYSFLLYSFAKESLDLLWYPASVFFQMPSNTKGAAIFIFEKINCVLSFL